MLVLTRKSQQAVVIRPIASLEIMLRVTILDVGRGVVRLGFEADESVVIHREEVWDKLHTGAAAERPAEGPAEPAP